MKTPYIIGIFVIALFAVIIVITQINPELTGDAIEVQQQEISFFQKIFGIKNTVTQNVEVIDNAIEIEDAEQVGEILVSDDCRAIKVEDAQLSGDSICSSIGKDCKWILAERTKTYYESDLNAPQINCNGMIQAIMKEYSLSAIVCSGISNGEGSSSCSRMTTIASAEPRLGEVKVSGYQPFEVMCC